ncbi:hypothetical protein C7444_12721 [Sphaerotilus hippei]|uniref:Uncharacterized protein n=1 Tax=Sphaerotilus hippei TaxID=744406 RepID=A0A318GV57_9BURK|nr:hypothetical protein [Sphaerotilus hippei]PXW92266.1 hypothetical protein C7444_12721 [Sphaerotilus hippei]
MKKRVLPALWAAGAAVAALVAPAAQANPSVGVTVEISQPGVYGRVDIGRFPDPGVIVARPVVIQQPPRAYAPEPVYLWVPPGHRRQWSRHCQRYGACNVPVYFVQDRWYNDHVMRDHDRRGDDRRESRRDDRRGDRQDDRWDERHGSDRRSDDRHPGQGHGPRRD